MTTSYETNYWLMENRDAQHKLSEAQKQVQAYQDEMTKLRTQIAMKELEVASARADVQRLQHELDQTAVTLAGTISVRKALANEVLKCPEGENHPMATRNEDGSWPADEIFHQGAAAEAEARGISITD